jgi:SNF2 family DNA or RNA helicase
MRFVYILFDKKIIIEVQDNRNKLSPFIRNKKILDNLEQKLSIEEDKIIFQFLRLLNKTYPPFEISGEFISLELLELINKIGFVFIKKTHNSSLKKIINCINYNEVSFKDSRQIIIPKKINIILEQILKEKVAIKLYFEFDEIGKRVPIDYTFLIPILEQNKLATVDEKQKKELLNIFPLILNKNIEDVNYINFEELNRLNENNFIKIEYKLEKYGKKSVDFVSNSLFKMKIFDKDNLEIEQLDFYYTILQNYLQNKSYVELENQVILLDEKNLIQDIDNSTLLKVFSYNLEEDIRLFIDKILNLKINIEKNDIVEELLNNQFNAILKDYQEDGVSWLYNLYKNNIEGGLLADEMGLGKTIQVIAFLLLSKTKSNLIIAPASLIHNWKKEILNFTKLNENDISLSIEKDKFISIVSYEYARSKIDDIKQQQYDILIMDESQKIKNHKTQIFNAITQIKRDFTVIMTGTPIENSLNDLWNMLFSINPSLHKLYINKIQPLLSNNEEYSKAIQLTINMLYPIMLQRKKNQVLNLPKRETKTILIDFSEKEEKKYKKLVNTFSSALASGLSGRIQSIALEGLLRLRQYCSIHKIVPNSLLTTYDLIDSKINIIQQLINEIRERNEKVIVFSQFTSSLDELEKLFKEYNYSYLRLDGSTTTVNRNKYVNQFQNNDSKVEIFLISLKAGGVGLNLTNARTAILFEPWWNPAVEEQAFARIDRIGQLQTTKIYRLIYKNSIEEKIDKLIHEKQNIFDSMSSFLIGAKNLEMEVARDIFKIS